MNNSWYTELSGVHCKLGQWWVPEREENGILLYRGTQERPPGAEQKLTRKQQEIFYEEEEEWYFALEHTEWKGDAPDYLQPLYRNGVQVGVMREYIGTRSRVQKRYMFADYGGEKEAYKAAFHDDAFHAFLMKYIWGIDSGQAML